MPLKLYQRSKVWHYRGTVAGRRLRGSCKTTNKDIAARAVAEIEAREWKCNFDGPQAVLTFAQAALRYRAAGKSTRLLDRIEDYWKDTLVRDIKPGMVTEMAQSLFPGQSGASLNRRAVIPTQAIINFAAKSELCQPIRVERFKVATKTKEPATLEWVEAFRAEASPHMGALALFMFLTGARVGEAADLQWEDIDLVQRTALIRESKVNAERRAHLPAPLFEALANLQRIPRRGVFVYAHPDDLRETWNAVIDRAGIKRLSPHCCRHGFATGLLRRGIDVVTVAKLGGWKTAAQVLKTYGHAIDDPKLTDVLIGSELTHGKPRRASSPRKIKAI
jgi:integrase